MEGLYVGRRLVGNIGSTTYGTLDVAILKKEELVADLKEKFGWDEEHKEVAHNLGLIKAFKDALALQPVVEEPTHNLTVQDVYDVAGEIGKTVTEEQAEQILDEYLSAQESDPGATWNLVIEHLIHGLI